MTGESTYSDVKTGDWYYNAVVWATEAGVVNGMGDGTFAPNDNITRQEMATMLYRLAKAEKVEEDKLASFPDAALRRRLGEGCHELGCLHRDRQRLHARRQGQLP